MAWKAGSFTILTTDTVSVAVTGLGFQPQGYWMTTNGLATASTSTTTNVRGADGLTDGTRQYCQYYAVRDGGNATLTRRGLSTTRVLQLVDYDGTAYGEFTHASNDADGFTLTTNVAAVANTVVHYVAWSGLDDQYLDIYTLGGGGSYSRTAAGFMPDAILHMTGTATATGNTSTAYARVMGWSLADGTQFSHGMRHSSAVTVNYTASVSATDRCMTSYDTAAEVTVGVEITSHDATGFTANRVTGTNANYAAAMHFRGGGTWKAGTTAAQSGAGTFDVTTAGITPAMVILASSNIHTASRTAPFEGGSVAWGAATGSTSRWANTYHSFNNETLGGAVVTEENRRTATDKFWLHNDRTSANTFTAIGEIDLSAFAANKFTLDQTDGDPTAILIGYIAVGTAVASGSNRNAGMMLGVGT